MTEQEQHIDKILTHPIEDDEDYQRLGDLVTGFVIIDPNAPPDKIVFEPSIEKVWWQDTSLVEDESDEDLFEIDEDGICTLCGEDVGLSSHYHCSICLESCSMMGHKNCEPVEDESEDAE